MGASPGAPPRPGPAWRAGGDGPSLGDARRSCQGRPGDWARETRSEIQLADVRSLLTSVAGLDEAYLARWTARLGLEDRYRDVRRTAGP
jgi:hypothetical protein